MSRVRTSPQPGFHFLVHFSSQHGVHSQTYPQNVLLPGMQKSSHSHEYLVLETFSVVSVTRQTLTLHVAGQARQHEQTCEQLADSQLSLAIAAVEITAHRQTHQP